VKALLALVIVLGACAGDVDEQWELRHDRIIAVRATPPGILSGETSVLDALVGSKESSPVEAPPEAATVISPMSLAGIVRPDAGTWIVVAPDEAKLAAARTELGLAADAPVPLTVGVSYAQQTLLGIKTVYLGEARQNPALEDMMIAGAVAPSGQTSVVVPLLTDVPLSVKGEDPDVVNWLTSCGTMHDFDLPKAYLRVEKEDPTEGDLAVVLRKTDGGVAWRVWPIHAE
jgi:hypothetical protein